MARSIFQKTPTERVQRTYDFSQDVPSESQSRGGVVTATDSSGAAVTSILEDVTQNDTIVSYHLIGGVDGEDYLIKISMIFEGGLQRDAFVELRVRANPWE